MKFIISSLLIFVIYSVKAQESYNFTIKEAVEYAIEHNKNLNKSKLEEEIIAAQIAEVKGRALPQISANARLTDNYSLAKQYLPAEIVGGTPGTTVGVTFGYQYNITTGVEVQQELLNLQLIGSLKSVQTLRELQDLNSLKTKEDLVINVIKVYLQVQIAEKQVELLNKNYDRSNSLTEISIQKLEEGLNRTLDVNLLKVNRSNLAIQLEDAKYTRDQTIRLLKVYLNLPLSTDVTLAETLEDKNSLPVQDSLSLNANISYRQLDKKLELSYANVNLSKADYYPTLNAFFTYSYQGNSQEFQFGGSGYQSQKNGTLGLSASIPIFNGLQKRRIVQQRKLESLKLKDDKVLLENDLRKSYADAKQQISIKEIQIENQEKNMQLAEENYEVLKLSYNEGVSDLSELLETEFQLRNAQTNYLNALLQFRVSQLQLLQTSGQLSTLLINN